MSMIVEMMAGERLRIGEAFITLEEKKGRNRSRIRIDAPRSVTIERCVKGKAQECHILIEKGDTHDDANRPG